MSNYVKGRFDPATEGLGFIDRSRLSTKRPFDTLDIGTNIKIDPEGRYDLRDGYDQIFETRPNWFEDTTLLANRKIQDNFRATIAADAAYISPRRNCLVEMESGGVRYFFAGIVGVKVPMALFLYRGVMNETTGIIAWSSPFTVYTNSVGAGFNYLGDDNADSNQQWIEFSMAKNSANSELYIAAVLRDDAAAVTGNNRSHLKAAVLTNLFTAGWSPQQDPLGLDSLGTTDLDIDNAASDAITHDIDIAVDSSDRATVAYGYYNSTDNRFEIHIRGLSGDYYDTEPFIITEAGFNFHSCKLAYNTAKSRMVMVYVKDSGGADSMRYVSWTNAAVNPSADATAIEITDTFAITATTGALFTAVPAFCIDSAGDLHFLYRRSGAGLGYAFRDWDAATTTLTNLASLFTVASLGAVTGITSGLEAVLTNWDMVVRGSDSTLSVHIYYVTTHATSGRVIHRCDKYGSGSFAVYGRVVHTCPATDPNVEFLCTDRATQTRASRHLIFFDIEEDGAPDTVDFMHLGEVLDAAEGDISIEAMCDENLTETDGTKAQTKIVHCSNNRLYRRNSTDALWLMLENTMDAENDAESWWQPMAAAVTAGGFGLTVAPNPVTHVKFGKRKGVIHAGYGVATKLCGASYRQINRRHFDNTGTYDYRDHFLDVDKILKAPDSSILVPTIAAFDAVTDTSGRAVSALIRSSSAALAANTLVDWFDVAGATMANTTDYRWPGTTILMGAPGANNHSVTPDEEFWASPAFRKYKAEGVGLNVENYMRMFRVGLSYVYDGYQESHLYVVPSDYMFNAFQFLKAQNVGASNPGLAGIGWYLDRDESRVFRVCYGITVNLYLSDLVNRVVSGTNPRITAVNVYLGEVMVETQKAEDVSFYLAKSVVVSQVNEFKNEWHKGEKQWVLNSGKWEHNDGTPGNYWPVVIDVDDYLAMFQNGTYESRNGHSDTFIDATYGLERSPFPEAWKAMETFGNQTVIGGVRIDGVNRKNRALINTRKVTADGQAVDTPDVYSDQFAVDTDFDIQDVLRIDDKTAVLLGDTGIGVLDVPSGTYERMDKNYGTDAPDSASDLSVGREGIGFLHKDRYLQFRGFNVEPEVMSEAITRTSEFGSITGINGISDKTDCWAFHIGDNKTLVLIFRVSPYAASDIPVFILDLSRPDGGWMQAYFSDAFKCGCKGIDEKMYFSSGYKVFQYPSGQTDNGTKFSPDIRLSDARLGENVEADIERFFVTHNLTNAETMTVTVIRDRKASLNIAHTVTGTGETVDTRRGMSRGSGRRIKREVSVRIQATTPTTFKIEQIAVEGLVVERLI